MSYVVGVATENRAIIMSDGRTRSIRTNEILNENYNKTKKLSQNVILGYAGSIGLCEDVIKYLFLKDDLVSTEKVIDHIISYLKSIDLSAEHNCMFIVAGLNSLNKMSSFTVSTSEGLVPAGGTVEEQQYRSSSLSPEDLDGLAILKKYLNPFPEDLHKAMKTAIFEVSELNDTVNKNCFYQEIVLDKSNTNNNMVHNE